MREITKVTKVYKYDELTEEQKLKVLENLYDINVEYGWWECVYEDAERVGLKIKGFDIDGGAHVESEFLASPEETAYEIEKEHGETCDTFKTAKDYLRKWEACVDAAERDENGELLDGYALDNALDGLDKEFKKTLSEDYLSLLRKEYEYQTSREAIEETIEANQYEFTEEGKLV